MANATHIVVKQGKAKKPTRDMFVILLKGERVPPGMGEKVFEGSREDSLAYVREFPPDSDGSSATPSPGQPYMQQPAGRPKQAKKKTKKKKKAKKAQYPPGSPATAT